MTQEQYLRKHFGEEKGQEINRLIARKFSELTAFCHGESKGRQKTMSEKILPRIAIYQSLLADMGGQEAYETVWDYTKTCICAPTARKYEKLEKFPMFFSLYRKAFLRIVCFSDKWTTENAFGEANRFGFEIHRCLWYDTCVKCGCPELCRVFCDSDYENFGQMKKTVFSRTQTLGTGGTMCDFVFSKKDSPSK